MDAKRTGEFIAALRKEKGLTQAALAEKLNISNRTVSKWENGDGYPDITSVPKLAGILGVTADELLNGERSAERSNEIRSNKSYKRGLKPAVIAAFLILIAVAVTAVGLTVKNNREFEKYGNLVNEVNYIHTNLNAFNKVLEDIEKESFSSEEIKYDGYMFSIKPDYVLLNKISSVSFSRDTTYFASVLHTDYLCGYIHCNYTEIPTPNRFGFTEIISDDYNEEYFENDNVYYYSYKNDNIFRKSPWYLIKPLGANWYYFEYHQLNYNK